MKQVETSINKSIDDEESNGFPTYDPSNAVDNSYQSMSIGSMQKVGKGDPPTSAGRTFSRHFFIWTYDKERIACICVVVIFVISLKHVVLGHGCCKPER